MCSLTSITSTNLTFLSRGGWIGARYGQYSLSADVGGRTIVLYCVASSIHFLYSWWGGWEEKACLLWGSWTPFQLQILSFWLEQFYWFPCPLANQITHWNDCLKNRRWELIRICTLDYFRDGVYAPNRWTNVIKPKEITWKLRAAAFQHIRMV